MSAIICIIAGCSYPHKKFFRRKLYFVQDMPALQTAPHRHQEPTITIWIHGARPFAANTYNLGLKSIDLFDQQDYIAQSINTLIKADPIKFPHDHFYVYSWTGILDFSERQKASNILYTEIVKLLDEYKKTHDGTPKIRIMAHSHGGNVALNLAADWNHKFMVDELILLAVPVQTKNQEFVHSPIFKHVLSLYSTIDIPQIIDPQLFYRESGTHLLFSGQRFTPAANLLQVKVKINGAACQHLQFNDIPTLTILPRMLDELYDWIEHIPSELLLAEDSRFMLSVYTNGRRAPRLKRYYSGDPNEHKELAYAR
jgi:pimeloyl-ACP methyl ester carboxylesterase